MPILIAVFALYPHRAIRINLLISLVALAASAVSRFGFLHTVDLSDHRIGSATRQPERIRPAALA